MQTQQLVARDPDRDFAATFTISPGDGFVRVRWQLDRLGGPWPGGDLLVKDPYLHFTAPGQPEVALRLIRGATRPEDTVCGQRAFRRMRGLPMPEGPWSYALALPPGQWTVRFTAELYDCVALTQYCDALNVFAGLFNQMVDELKEAHRRWHDERGHGGAPPFQFACDLALGSLDVAPGLTSPPRYFLSNEAELEALSWEDAPPLAHPPAPPGAPLHPSVFFDRQVRAGIDFMCRYHGCRYGTHNTEQPAAPGPLGTGLRVFVMWGSTYTTAYLASGDRELGAAGWYAVRHGLSLFGRKPAPHQHHALPLGLFSVVMTRFARATHRPDLVRELAACWRAWPYNWQRHMMATEPAADGSDLTDNDTYNMKLSAAHGQWLLGKYLGDEELLARGADCVRHFILPGLLAEGYWNYRPNAPEGQVVDGMSAKSHYDGFVKSMLGRLLFHPEWQADGALREALHRGMAHTIGRRSVSDGRTRVFRDLDYPQFPQYHLTPRAQLAESLGRAACYAETLVALALAGDHTWDAELAPILQWVYDQRDNPLLADYWDNSWLYGFYTPLLTLGALGVRISGPPDAIQVTLPPQAPILA